MSDSQFYHLVDILSQRALEQPEQTAYIFLGDGETETARLTYQQLDQKAKAIASRLQELGLENERVLLAYPSGLDFIAAFCGCLYGRVIAVPVNLPKRSQKIVRFETVANDVTAKAVLTSSSLISKLESWLDQNTTLNRASCLFTDNINLNKAEAWQKPNLEPDSLAFIQYTSGSTNIPKGVMVSHANLFHNQKAIAINTKNNPETVGVSWLPLHHDMGLIGHMLQALFVGKLNVLMPPESFLQKPFRWLKAISDYRGTISSSPNFAYELCLQKITPEQKAKLDLSSWQVAMNGAEPVRAKTMEKFTSYFASCGFCPEAFCPTYGMAETTLFVSGGSPSQTPKVLQLDRQALMQNRAVIAKENTEDTKIIVSCGTNWQDSKVAIAHPQTLTRCQSGEIGEIWVNSPAVAIGYWQQPEKNKRIFQAQFKDREESWLRTGDLGFLLDGELYVTGRLKDAIVVRGCNHYPQDIELTVGQSHSALKADCIAAFSVDLEDREKLVIAAEIERTYLRKLDRNAVVKAVRQAVFEQHRLQVDATLLLRTATIPKTSSGKLARYACREGFLAGSLNVVGQWINNTKQTTSLPLENTQPSKKPQTEEDIENWIVQRLATYLQVDPKSIEISESFAQYGLDSSVAVTITEELAQWLDRELEPILFWEYPSIETLAKFLFSSKADDQ